MYLEIPVRLEKVARVSRIYGMLNVIGESQIVAFDTEKVLLIQIKVCNKLFLLFLKVLGPELVSVN